jgi:hypothetical protein
MKPFMNTPRDILFARHQATAPKLDAIRREVMAVEQREGRRAAVPQFRAADTATLPILIWRELIFPCRRIWAGLAAVWILICIVNVSQRDNSRTLTANFMPTAGVMMTFRDQQKLLNELFADRSFSMDAEQPRIFLPKPRTETMKLLTG